MARSDLTKASLTTAKLDDPVAERVRDSHHRAITELRERLEPFVFKDIALAPGAPVTLRHRLGRKPTFVGTSCVRATPAATPGTVKQYLYQHPINNLTIDPSEVVVLVASGFGETVFVDMLVM